MVNVGLEDLWLASVGCVEKLWSDLPLRKASVERLCCISSTWDRNALR